MEVRRKSSRNPVFPASPNELEFRQEISVRQSLKYYALGVEDDRLRVPAIDLDPVGLITPLILTAKQVLGSMPVEEFPDVSCVPDKTAGVQESPGGGIRKMPRAIRARPTPFLA
jgi:hypothetical protein